MGRLLSHSLEKKCQQVDPRGSDIVWTVTGLMKIFTTLVVYNTPDTIFHQVCCACCIADLAIAILGTILDLDYDSNNAPRGYREISEGLMRNGTLISFIPVVIKGVGYLSVSSYQLEARM